MPSVHPKRQRIDRDNAVAPTKQPAPSHSRILAPFRSVGHITSATPFSLLPLGQTFQLTTALAHTVQTYDVRKLNLLFVSSPPTPGTIQRVVAHKDVVYVAFEDPTVGVWVFKRGKKVAELQHMGAGWTSWKDLIVFGDWVVGVFGRGLIVWRRETGELYTEIEMQGAAGEVTAACHPSTFLNKLVVARRSGSLEIWNVKTSKLIYNILSPLPAASSQPNIAITTLSQAPVVNVIAIGYSTGQIHLHNVRTDNPLFSLNAPTDAGVLPHKKRVTSLSFCTDPFVGAGKKQKAEGGGRMLAVGHDDGDVTLWNLEKRVVAGVMRNVHEGSYKGITVEWLAGQNVLVTSGGDNSIKEWIFDSPHTSLPRILRSRAGHSKPITALTFVSPTTSHFLLSSSLDHSLRAQSLRNDSQSFEFSQGAAVKKATKAAKQASESLASAIEAAKAGPITCIATSAGDDGAGSTGREWENIVTGHQRERAARAWSFQNKKIGRWVLDTHDGGEVKAVAVSACGTFAYVGSAGGGIDMYNLQSGLHRRRFPQPLTPQQAKKVRSGEARGSVAMLGKGKHTKAVSAILTDSLNRVVVSTGLDGRIKFWEFATGILLHELNWEGTSRGAITKARLHRPSELLAVACDDLCIRVIDIETRRVVRELWGCSGRISDFAFSNDARWVVAASMDSVIRIWDLPTGHLIDGLRTRSIVTALAFAGTGEFLATAHVDDVGINIWTNRTLFRYVAPRHITEDDIVDITTPTVSGEGGTSIIAGAFAPADEDGGDALDTGAHTTADQISENLLTLSLVPKTRWQTLLNLEAIRQRNKPKEAPKAPEKAPFFLPSLGASADAFAPATSTSAVTTSTPANPSSSTSETRLTNHDLALATSTTGNSHTNTFTTLLLSSTSTTSTSPSSHTSSHTSPFIAHLKSLPPSHADLEIRSLHHPTTTLTTPTPHDGELPAFVTALTQHLHTRRDFELVLTWMNVFLRCHAETVKAGDVPGLDDALRRWVHAVKAEKERLAARAGYCKGVVAFLRSSR